MTADNLDVVEAVARALHDHEDSWNDMDWEYVPSGTQELFRSQATAALKACNHVALVAERDALREALHNVREEIAGCGSTTHTGSAVFWLVPTAVMDRIRKAIGPRATLQPSDTGGA